MFKLRDYQEDSISEVRQVFKSGINRQVLCSATGSGKSVLALFMIKSAMERNKRILFLCERRILVDQFSSTLMSEDIEHGVLMSGSTMWRPDRQLQVGTAQTIEKMDGWPKVDLLIVDEIHACMRKSLVDFMSSRPNMRVVGLTATPYHPLLSKNFDSITNVIAMRDLVETGVLVPFKVFASTEVDIKGLKVVAGEWKKDDLEDRTTKITGSVVDDYIQLSHNVFGEYRKTICFSAGVMHGAALQDGFNSKGINAIQLSYKDSDEYKRAVMEEFRRPDSDVTMLISVGILERGLDVTDVEHVILCRPLKKSFSSHVQSIGRGARSHPGKEFCVIQDHSGNWLRFADQWYDLYNNGCHELKKLKEVSKGEPTEIEKKASKCPSCGKIWQPSAKVCSHCGFVRVIPSGVVEVEGVMKEITQQPGYTREFKENFYRQLLGYSLKHNKRMSLVEFWYKKKFDEIPRFVNNSALAPGEEIDRWVKHLNIRYAKQKRR